MHISRTVWIVCICFSLGQFSDVPSHYSVVSAGDSVVSGCYRRIRDHKNEDDTDVKKYQKIYPNRGKIFLILNSDDNTSIIASDFKGTRLLYKNEG